VRTGAGDDGERRHADEQRIGEDVEDAIPDGPRPTHA